ncbi:hypothetical protein J4E08_14035 [Sagittula sp. NFXS13]|uniref:hypothetical protein n=1 Tax=Sagittula sp. NFXS13 TaxID=2819095 RepID=UPI0032DF01CB
MRKTLTTIAILLAMTAPLSAETLDGQQTYDLLFKEGTLTPVSKDMALRYNREVSNSLKPDAAERDTGSIVLSFEEKAATMALLQFQQDGKKRGLGSFPASVGNPMIMYFYETVVRDMAEAAGGSPFYIRNRVKESLIRPTEPVVGEAEVNGETVSTQTVRLYPFANDPNRAQMKGFGDLELTVTMSEDVPGWYLSLEALAQGEGDTPVYHSEIDFTALEASE